MAIETLKIYSGENRGSGQSNLYEGWIRRYKLVGDPFEWLFEIDNSGEEDRVGYAALLDLGTGDPNNNHMNNQWRSYLSFDLTGVDVSTVQAVRLGLWLHELGTIVYDPPFQSPALSIRYGSDAWLTLSFISWNRAGTQWPSSTGNWEPPFSEWAGAPTGGYKVFTATDLTPVTNFAGELLQLRLGLATFPEGIGQYTTLRQRSADKWSPYLELDLEVDDLPGKEKIPGRADSGPLNGKAASGPVVARAGVGIPASAGAGAIIARRDSGDTRGR